MNNIIVITRINAIKQVDVVISIVGLANSVLADQVKLIAAIKEAGNLKRFLPSEFGFDMDRHHAVEPAKSMYETKTQIRRAVEVSGIPREPSSGGTPPTNLFE
ncbi:hypothetical protein vseg_012672 [Gypsophila vaccaria]